MKTHKIKNILILVCLTLGAGYFIRYSNADCSSASPDNISSMMKELASRERCFELTQKHIDILRKLPVRWLSNVENGMAMLDLRPSYWVSFLPTPLANLREMIRSEQSKMDLEAAFQIYLAFARMPAGSYPLVPGDVVDAEDDPQGEGTVQKNSEFRMTEQHLKLLKNANGRWEKYFNGLVIDPKRPYGDMTYFELDMADILGIPLEDDGNGHEKVNAEQQKLFDRLFRDLPVSLRVFLKNAAISPGKFCRKPAGWGPWRRVTSSNDSS